MSRILAMLMVLGMVGLAGAQPSESGSHSRRSKKNLEIVPLTAQANASTTQTSAPLGVVTRPSAPVAASLDTTIPLSLNQVPLDQLVRFMADTTGKTVIKQRDLNTQVSVNAPKPVTKREALELIYSALQLDNIYVAEQDDMLMLINFQSIKNIRMESIPSTVDVQSLPDSLRIVQKMYKFDNINPASVRAHLDLFMPNTSMTIEPQSNTLIITDQLKRIKGYDKIIKALDTGAQDKVLDVYKLNSASAPELALLLRNLIQSGALADSGDTSETVIRPTRTGSDIVMFPDPRLNWIIALCPKNQKAALDQLVTAFDVGKTDDYIVQIYKLEKSEASQMVGLLNNVISNKGLTATTSGAPQKNALPVGGKNSKLWKRLAEQLGGKNGSTGKAAQAGDILLISDYRLNWVIAIMRPDLKAQMDDLVKQFDVERKMDVQTHMLTLKTANANAIYGTVMNLISGIPMSNPRDYIRIMPSQDNSSLIVMASDSNFKLVQELVDKVQTMPENRIVQIYKLTTADASQLSYILQAIITNRGLKGDTVATLGNWGQPGDVMLYPEYRQNWLIAILRPDLKPQLDELVKQFDSTQTSDIQARTVELKGNNALALTITVQRLISALPINSARDYATIMPSDDGKKLIVMSSEAKFKTVQELIQSVETVPTDKVMQIYPMKHADVVQMATFINNVLTNKGKYKSSVGAAAGDSEGRGMGFYLRRMMESGGAANGGDLLMIPETRLNWLVVIMKPEIKTELDALIEQFDVQSTQEIKPHMLDLKGANPAQVAATVTRLLMGRANNSPKDTIQVMPSDDGKQLIVMSSETNFKIVEEMVATIAVVPADKAISIYKLVNAQTTQLIPLLNSILATKGISTSAGGTATSTNNLGGEDEGRGFRYLRRMMSGGGNATGVSGDVLMIPEARLNWIIAITKPAVKPELDSLVQQFDVEKTKELQTRLVDLKGANAASVYQMVDRVISDLDMDSPDNPKDYVRVFPSDDGKKLVVMSNEANYKMVEEMVGTLAVIPGDKTVEVYKLTNADAAQVATTINTIITSKGKLTSSISAGAAPASSGSSEDRSSRFMRRMMMMGAAGGNASSSDLLMIPDTRLNWIFAIVTAAAKPEVEALIKQLDVKSAQDVQTRLLDLKGANATQVAGTVTRLLAGRQTENPKEQIQVMPSDDGKKLIVMSNETNYQLVEEMVSTVAVVPTNKSISVYKLVYADASQLISMINSVLVTKNISSSSAVGAAPTSPSGSSSDSGGFRYMRRMMAQGAMSGTGATGSGDVLMIPDMRLNWIIAITKPEVKPELDTLVKQFDVDKIKDVQTRTLDLKGANATAVSATINRLIMGMTTADDPKNYIRVIPSDDNKKLIVLSSEANYKMVEEMAATVAVMPTDRTVSIYKLVYADAAQLITLVNSIFSTKGISTSASGAAPTASGTSGGSDDSSGFRYMRRMMMTGGGAATGTNTASDVIMIPETRLNWVIAMTKPALKAELDELVKQFDVESSREMQARLLPVKTLSAQAMATMVNNLLAARGSSSGSSSAYSSNANQAAQNDIRVMPTDDNQKLIVMSSEANYKVVQDLVQTLDAIPDDRVVETYKLKFADASELTALLQNVILKSPMMKGSASATTGNLYSRYSRYFGGGGGLGASGSYGSSSGGYGSGAGPAAASGSVQIGNIILIPDTRLNWIVAIAPKDQKTELDKLVLQFDIEKPKDQQARVIELLHTDATDLAQNLNQILREQMTAGRRESVRVSATDDGTKLLVWSTEANFKDIQRMVKELDVETPKDVQARMLDVKYADANQLATTLNNLFRDQFWGSGSKKEYVRVSATEDGMRLMVMSSEANHKIIEDLITKLDTKEAESQVTKVYKVENLEAQDMADQLTRLFEERSKTNNSGGFADMYYGGYGNRSRNGSTQTPQPAIVPSPRNNTVMVMARPKDMDFLEQMVKELDVPINPQDFEPRTYHIHNTDASEVVNVLQSLFSGTGNSRTQTTNYYFDSWRPNRNNQNKDAIEAVFGKLRFVVDRQTNTIVALSSNPKNYEIIDSVIEKLDQPDPENSEVMVFDLKYADALKIANQVNYLFSLGQTQRPNTTQQNNNDNNDNNKDNSGMTDTINELQDEQVQDFVPLWGTAGNQLTSNRTGDAQRPINTMIGNVRVVPDIRSNKLMVAAPPVYFPTLNKLIESLDHNEPQVYITTRIVEITRGKERRIGIRWTPDASSIEPGELDNAMLALNQLGFTDTFGHGDQPDKAKIGGTVINQTIPGMTGVGSKSITQTLKNGNSVISSNVNIGLLVQLLVKNSESRIYTEPGVTVNNNETGNIFFGSEFPFQSNVQNTDNGNQNIGVKYKPVGINLDIRPHINSNDEIVLKAAVENSNVRAETVNGQLIKDMRRFTTEVSLKNGETMVIGGILTDDGSKVKHGVPILSSIPVVKYLFSKKDDTQDLRELVFFVTPQIIETTQDSRQVLADTNRELKAIEDLEPQKLDSLRKYEDVPAPKANGNGNGFNLHNGGRNSVPSEIQSFQLHRPPSDAPQVITLSDDDKKAALKALKEVEYENRQAVPRSSSSRSSSKPDGRTPDNKPFVMGIPAETKMVNEGGNARGKTTK